MGITTGEKPLVGVTTQLFGNVEIETWFCGNKSHRPAILLIHGMFGGSWYFDGWAKFLCEKGFVVYVIKDLHKGENLTRVDFYTYLEKSIRVVEAICFVTDDKIILIGHSMGGLIAQKIAAINLHLVAGLVLVASAPPKGVSAMSWDVAKAMAKHFLAISLNLPLKIDRKSAFKLLLSWLGGEERKEQLFKRFVPESSIVAKQLAFSRIPVDETNIFCKTLVVAGAYDKLLPMETQVKIADKYDAEGRTFLNGHMMMLEDYRDEIISVIYNWIDTNLVH